MVDLALLGPRLQNLTMHQKAFGGGDILIYLLVRLGHGLPAVKLGISLGRMDTCVTDDATDGEKPYHDRTDVLQPYRVFADATIDCDFLKEL